MERRPVERVRGTQDSWPHDAQRLDAVRRHLEATFASFGYRRIDVPVLEPAELHLRKSGLEIVSKLYGFDDLGGRRLCLRPELTASVVRAYVAQPAPRLPVKVFSSGPVFRYERPSRGRYRQFTQSGVELIGPEGALADAEVVFLAMHALERLGLRDYRVTIGHIGIVGELLAGLGLTGRWATLLMESLEEARRHGLEAVKTRLRELDPELFDAGESTGATEPVDRLGGLGETEARAVVASLLAELGADALGRRSLDEVVERMVRKLRAGPNARAVERALAFIGRLGALHGAPGDVLRRGRELLREFDVDDAPLRQLEESVALLECMGAGAARVQLDLGLSRGLQYYTGMVFEIDHAGLGAESQLCGGGRYDDLIRALGARYSTPALGFAFGVERVLLALDAEARDVVVERAADVFVVPASAPHEAYAIRVAQALRHAALCAHLEVGRRPLRASLAYAGREGFAQVVVVGETEEREGTIRVRDMATGEEHTVPLAIIVAGASGASGAAGDALGLLRGNGAIHETVHER
ncbi:MAG: histidine--tRNA ligase [Chloroflexi bacterium]|nr:histidine--tRNA ligase [Chloroflexota bacterium]